MNSPADDAPPIRRRLLYRGHVQGVGFRFTARETAADYDVTGFVRNLPDLSRPVEVVAEGRPEELDRFLADLARRMDGYIGDVRVEESPATGEFAGFEVRH